MTLHLAFTQSLWLQTVRSEVYALNFLITSIICYLALRAFSIHCIGEVKSIQKQPSPPTYNQYLFFIFFILGLGAGNHSLLVVVIVPAIVLFFMIPKWADTGIPPILLCGILFVLGLSIYLYLPIRAATNPPLNWGSPDSLDRLIWVISGKTFQKSFHITLEKLILNCRETAFILMAYIHPLLFFWGILGIYLAIRQNFILGGFLCCAFLLNLLTVLTQQVFLGDNPDLLGYLLFSVLILHIGVYHAVTTGLNHIGSIKRYRFAKTAALSAVIALIGASIFLLIARNAASVNQSNNFRPNDYGKAVINSVKPGSYLITSNVGTAFIAWYLQYVENYRTDVILIHKPFLSFDWYVRQLKNKYALLRHINEQHVRSIDDLLSYLTSRPVFLELGLGTPDTVIPYLVPKGFVFELTPQAQALDQKVLAHHNELTTSISTILLENKKDVESLKVLYWHNYCAGVFFAKKRLYQQARLEFQRCMAINPNAKEIQAMLKQVDIEEKTGNPMAWKFFDSRSN
jgi:hypothetical protein